MPLYEYSCNNCRANFTVLLKNSTTSSGACPNCGKANLHRLMSTCFHHKTTSDVYQESGQPTMFPKSEYYKDPRNIGRGIEEKFDNFGLDMPQQVREEINAAREGVLPKELEQ